MLSTWLTLPAALVVLPSTEQIPAEKEVRTGPWPACYPATQYAASGHIGGDVNASLEVNAAQLQVNPPHQVGRNDAL